MGNLGSNKKYHALVYYNIDYFNYCYHIIIIFLAITSVTILILYCKRIFIISFLYTLISLRKERTWDGHTEMKFMITHRFKFES